MPPYAVGLGIALATLMATLSAAAASDVHRDFDGPGTAWKPLDDRVPMRLQAHECVADGARDVAGCEHIAVVAPAGESAQLACTTPPMAVLDEFAARMWVKATQPGVQLAARITLPRSVGVRHQSAVTVIVRGELYSHVGRWQQLELINLPKQLAAQVRVLRTEPGASVDPREAFVDAIVLLVPGGTNPVEVWTDDLDVDGVVLDDRSGVRPAAFSTAVATPQSSTVRLQGGMLQVDGHAFLPRVIEWRGEPLAFLSERGFNTVKLAALPTDEQSTEARQLGLWFLCPPPRPDELDSIGISPASDRVSAWHLVDDTSGVDPDYLRRWAELVRQKDPMVGRPIVVTPESDWESACGAADIVVARHLLAGRMSDVDFRKWLTGRRQLADPGTSIWVCLPTQYDESVGRQCDALSQRSAPPPNVDDALPPHNAAAGSCSHRIPRWPKNTPPRGVEPRTLS
jgi:hypothetical protein